MLTDKDRENAKQRREAIHDCGTCDEAGWGLGTDGRPVDPARRCTHTTEPDWRDQ